MRSWSVSSASNAWVSRLVPVRAHVHDRAGLGLVENLPQLARDQVVGVPLREDHRVLLEVCQVARFCAPDSYETMAVCVVEDADVVRVKLGLPLPVAERLVFWVVALVHEPGVHFVLFVEVGAAEGLERGLAEALHPVPLPVVGDLVDGPGARR